MDDFEKLDRKLQSLIKKIPSKKRELVEEVGIMLEQQVKFNIAERVERKTGHLGDAVTKKVGTKGGYVVVKPDYSIAHHTHLIEKGHKIVRNKITIGFVNGKFMYRDSVKQCEKDILTMANDMIKEVADEW